MKLVDIARDEVGKNIGVSVLLGRVIEHIKNNSGEELIFEMKDGARYSMYHDQDCCEQVHIEEIVGDLEDLLDSPLTEAEETSQDNPTPSDLDGTSRWTFYRFRTKKGSVVIRWLGESNGYYGVEVDFKRIA